MTLPIDDIWRLLLLIIQALKEQGQEIADLEAACVASRRANDLKQAENESAAADAMGLDSDSE